MAAAEHRLRPDGRPSDMAPVAHRLLALPTGSGSSSPQDRWAPRTNHPCGVPTWRRPRRDRKESQRGGRRRPAGSQSLGRIMAASGGPMSPWRRSGNPATATAPPEAATGPELDLIFLVCLCKHKQAS